MKSTRVQPRVFAYQVLENCMKRLIARIAAWWRRLLEELRRPYLSGGNPHVYRGYGYCVCYRKWPCIYRDHDAEAHTHPPDPEITAAIEKWHKARGLVLFRRK